MSELRTLNSSCPCLTLSPSRASISRTRPDANDGTGTCRDTSGLTTPVAFSSGAAMYSRAVASGKRSGWSTLKLSALISGWTVAGCGPVSSLALDSPCNFPHPLTKNTKARQRVASINIVRFMGQPHDRRQDLIERLTSGKPRSGSDNSVGCSDNHFARLENRAAMLRHFDKRTKSCRELEKPGRGIFLYRAAEGSGCSSASHKPNLHH